MANLDNPGAHSLIVEEFLLRFLHYLCRQHRRPCAKIVYLCHFLTP